MTRLKEVYSTKVDPNPYLGQKIHLVCLGESSFVFSEGKNFKKNLTVNGGKCEYEELSEKKGKRFYGFIFDFEFGEFEFYTFDLSPNYDSNFTESVVYTCDKVDPL